MPETHRVAQNFEAFVAIRTPQVTLDPELLALCTDQVAVDPPALNYGLVFNQHEIDKFLARHNVVIVVDGQAIADDPERAFLSTEPFIRSLSRMCKYDLRLTTPLSAPHGHCLVALDDTQRLWCTQRKIWQKSVQPVLRTLRKELNLDPKTKTQWWWNFYYDDWCSPSLYV